MTLTPSDIDFIQQRFDRIEGWCEVESAYVTASLMNFQNERNWGGGAFEIGVYLGKYLSVLYQKARERNARTVGVDTFQWRPPEDVTGPFQEVFGELENLELVKTSSRELTAGQILERLGGEAPAIVSVDGDHSAEAVAADLALAQELAAPHGVVSLDDFLNPRAIGVSEGAYRFFLGGESRLKPFVFCANKLYLCRDAYYEAYKGAVEALTEEQRELSFIQAFHELAKNGRHWVEQPLLGSAPWVF